MSAEQNDTWDYPMVVAVVRKLVVRKLPLFAKFPDVGRDDLEQEAAWAVTRAWPRFDATKGAASTFIYTVAARRLLSLSRALRRRMRRDELMTALTPRITPTFDPVADFDPDDMADWLAGVIRTVRRNL